MAMIMEIFFHPPWLRDREVPGCIFPGKWDCRQQVPGETQFTRRLLCTSITTSLVAILTSEPVKAVEDKQEDDNLFGAIKSLFVEKTKSGKELPKGYVESAREVLKTLRQSLKEDPKDIPKFRRTADAAKDSIRNYLNNWRGQQSVVKEESYMELEKVFRTLAGFYAKAGPSASLSDEVKSEICTS
ncbi:Photosystem II D1 precursor processing protein PSB27-H2 chloroplastic [Bienertia sinuspersici]